NSEEDSASTELPAVLLRRLPVYWSRAAPKQLPPLSLSAAMSYIAAPCCPVRASKRCNETHLRFAPRAFGSGRGMCLPGLVRLGWRIRLPHAYARSCVAVHS